MKTNKTVKKIFILLLVIIFIYAFSKSYTTHSIDNLSYAIAMGIDTADSDPEKLKITFQLSTISSSGDSGSAQNSTVTNVVEASSIDSAINLMNAYIDKELNLAHCKIIIISEEVASKGIATEIYSLINNTQLRPTANVVITKCTANDYIKNSESDLTKLVTKYYSLFPDSSKFTGYTTTTTIGDLFNGFSSYKYNNTAILGGLNNSEIETDDTHNTSGGDFDITSGQSPIIGERGTENFGLAVFDGDTLVGELTAIETLCHLVISNKVDTFLIAVPDPNDNDSTIDMSVSPKKNSKISVDIVNGMPYIKVQVFLNAKILTINQNSNYTNSNNLDDLSNYANIYLKNQITDYLYKTSKELESDIDAFGNYAIRHFTTYTEWIDYGWLDNYKNSFFDINVDTNVQSSLLLTES